jgi:hypothetical protein
MICMWIWDSAVLGFPSIGLPLRTPLPRYSFYGFRIDLHNRPTPSVDSHPIGVPHHNHKLTSIFQIAAFTANLQRTLSYRLQEPPQRHIARDATRDQHQTIEIS